MLWGVGELKRLLVVGGSGLLGSNISLMAARKFDVVATYCCSDVRMDDVDFIQVDLSDASQVSEIEHTHPDYVINCAALTSVDYCEEHPDEAYSVNVTASLRLAEASRRCGARLVHISTDAVFDGAKGDYSESDRTAPLSVYGKSKLEAERGVLAAYPRACVIRTNIYGWNKRAKHSLAEWMLSRLEGGIELPALKDVFFSPILVNDLADSIFMLMECDYEGVIHVAGSETCNKLAFAHAIADVFGLDDSIVRPTSIDELGLRAPRGKNTSLNVNKAEALLDRRMPSVKEGLWRMRHLREQGFVRKLKNG